MAVENLPTTIIMDLPSFFFADWALWLANGLTLALLGLAATRVRWHSLAPHVLNAWLGGCVLIMVLWLMKGGFKPGLSFHLIGAAVLTLLAGAPFALLGLAAVLLAVTAGTQGDWLAMGINWLATVLVPVMVVRATLHWARHKLPGHFFVYVFVNAFSAGGFSMFAAGLTGLVTLGLAEAYPWDYLLADTLPFYFLLSWSEAFTTGLVIAVMVVYRPQWVSTFDDAHYLRSPDDDDI
ncbi:energy-coupling factor ABC transporter permease [Paludibacterium denitrificans]|nr:energy-coupling factor ABC transporter permease [Paludibacterium denitrificans]